MTCGICKARLPRRAELSIKYRLQSQIHFLSPYLVSWAREEVGWRSPFRNVAVGDAMVRIDCKLMDSELLASMLESIEESKVTEKGATTLLLDNLECLAEPCVSLLVAFLKTHEQSICIATCDPSSMTTRTGDNSLWSELILRTGVLRVDLPRLVDRLEDFPTLVNAWFAARSKSHIAPREISESFLDAVVAYSWPGGVEEFSEALTHASNGGVDAKLTDKELPVNIRTCVSHVEETQVDETVDLDSILESVEKTMILGALAKFPKNKTSSAKILNISRARLIRRLQQWGIQSESTSVESDDDTPDFNEVE
jgi:DNA-binding NtrC family response regulator